MSSFPLSLPASISPILPISLSSSEYVQKSLMTVCYIPSLWWPLCVLHTLPTYPPSILLHTLPLFFLRPLLASFPPCFHKWQELEEQESLVNDHQPHGKFTCLSHFKAFQNPESNIDIHKIWDLCHVHKIWYSQNTLTDMEDWDGVSFDVRHIWGVVSCMAFIIWCFMYGIY